MGKLDRVMALAGAVLALACTKQSEPVGSASLRAESMKAAQRAADAGQGDVRLDAEGNLKSSGRRIGWLELPTGFRELSESTPRLATFEAEDLPLELVNRYLEARLVPAQVDQRKNGTSFRNAKPSHTRLEMPAMHVTALTTDVVSRKVRLTIEDLSPPPKAPLPLDVAAREQQRERTHAE